MAAPFLLHWYVMGDVPVAAILNVAVWPARILALKGCVEMDGAIADGAGVELPPSPLRATDSVVPFACLNLREPE